MADSSVLLEVIVEGKNIKVVQKDVDKLAKSVNKTGQAHENASGKQDKFNKGAKGVAGATANGTKAFSKMRNEIGGGSSGLVGAYATLAANIFAATALFGALQKAAQVETLLKGVEQLGISSGTNIAILAEGLREATGSAISLDQALRTASFGTSAGFDSSTLEQLTSIAKKAAIALGRDVGDSVDRLVRGVAKLEPEILDELGLIVRLKDATEAYASSVGKTANQLTVFERSQAFANATIQQGLDKYASVDDSISSNPYDKLSASLQDLAKNFLNIINTVLGPFISFLAENKIALGAFIVVLTQGILRQALPALTNLASKAKEAAGDALLAVQANDKQFKKMKTSANKAIKSVTGVSKAEKEFIASIRKGKVAVKDQELFIKKLEARLKSRNKAIQEGTAKTKATIQGYNSEIASLQKLIPLLQQRADVENRRSRAPGGGAGDLLKTESLKRYADGTAGILEDLESNPSLGNFFAKFKEGRKVGKDFRKEMAGNEASVVGFAAKLPIVGPLLGKAGVAMLSFGAAGRVALLGITYALPIIGQIILALTLIAGVAKKAFSAIVSILPAQSQLSKAQDKVAESAEHYTKVLAAQEEQLVNLAVVQATGTEEEKKAAQQRVSVTQRTKAAGNALKDYMARSEAVSKASIKNTEDLNMFSRAFLAISRTFSAIGDSMIADFAKLGSSIGIITTKISLGWAKLVADSEMLTFMFGNAEEDVVRLTKTLDDLTNADMRMFSSRDLKQFGMDLRTAGNEVNMLKDIFEAGGAPAQEIADAVGATSVNASEVADLFADLFATKEASKLSSVMMNTLNNLLGVKEAAELFKDGQIDINEQQKILNALLKRSTEETVNNATKVEGLVSVFKDLEEPVNEYLTALGKANTPMTEMVRSLDQLYFGTKGLNDITKEAFLEQVKSMSESTKTLLGITEAMENQADLVVAQFRKRYKELVLLENLVRLEKTRVALNGRVISHLKTAGSLNTAAYKAQVSNNNNLLRIQKNRNKQQQQELGLGEETINKSIQLLMNEMDLTEAGTERRAKLQSLIELKKEELDFQDRTIDSEREGLEIQKIGLEIAGKALQNTKAEANLEIARFKTAAKRAALFSAKNTGEISPNEELKLAMREADIKIKMVQLEFDLTVQKVALERSLLALRLKILEREGKIQESEKNNILSDFDKIGELTKKSGQIAIDSAKQAKDALGLDLLAKSMQVTAPSVSSSSGGIPDMSRFMGSDTDAITNEAKKQLGKDTKDRKQAQIDNIDPNLSAGEIAGQMFQINEAFAKSEGLVAFRGQLLETRLATQHMIDGLMALGPEGELVGSIASGIFTIGDSLAILGDKTQDSASKFEAASAIIGSIGAIAAAAGQQKIAAIDAEIAAEKKRDGKSKESIEKIKQLEKKKEAAARKNFNTNKKIQMAQTVVNTAASVMRAFAEYGFPGAILAGVLGAAQLAIIAGTSFQGGSSNSDAAASTPTITVGKKTEKTDLAASSGAAGELAYFRGESGSGGPENFQPKGAFMGAKYRATGGPTAGYVVGEQGPELFVPETPGSILPNDQMKQSAPVNANISISALDASGVEEILVAQRGNIIGMLREAVNSYGEDFYEDIDTAVYTPSSAGAGKY